MNFELTAPVAKGLLDYLMKQPYGEVAGLISAIQKLRVIKESAPDPVPDPVLATVKEVDTEKKVA